MKKQKRCTQILRGTVCGAMLMALSATITMGQNAVEIPPSQAPEDPAAFTCEARIGNAALSPNNWNSGTFEYDIGPDTAHPVGMGQFGWPDDQTVTFSITYTPPVGTSQFGKARFHVDNRPDVEYDVPKTLFGKGISDGSGYTDIHLRTRHVYVGSRMEWSNLVLTVNGVNYPLDLNHIGTLVDLENDSRTMMIAAVPGMQMGFILTGDVRMAWGDTVPSNSRINGQVSFHERSGVVKVEWVGIKPGTSGDTAVEEELGETETTQNPETHGGGIRYYPEKDQSGSNPRDQIRVKVTVGKATGYARTVVMRIFDMDDPTAPQSYNVSPSDCVIDPLDCQGEAIYGRLIVYGDDNRKVAGEPIGASLPKGKWGSLAGEEGYVYAVLPANATTADYTFNFWNEDESVWLAPQPGNNWRILAQVLPGGVDGNTVPDSSYLKAMEVDVDWEYSVTSIPGLDVRLGSYQVPGAIKSPLLTVWRTLHLEVDAMEPMPNQNDPNANPNTIVGNLAPNDDGFLIKQSALLPLSYIYVDHDLTTVFPHDEDNPDQTVTDDILGSGRFQGGEVKLGANGPTRDVTGNGKKNLRSAWKNDFTGEFRFRVNISKDGNTTEVRLLSLNITSKTIQYMDVDGESPLTADFVGGTLNCEGVDMTISEVDADAKIITVANIPPIRYELHDDDYDFLLGWGNPDEQPRYPDITMVSDALADAYVSVMRISPEDNPTIHVSFILNWDVDGDMTTAGTAYDNSLKNHMDWWCAHLTTAYQSTTLGLYKDPDTGAEMKIGDHDPDGERLFAGLTDEGTSQSVVFLECIADLRSQACPLDPQGLWSKFQERIAVVHELGHVLTQWSHHPVTKDDENDECNPPEGYPTKTTYTPDFLNRIRQSTKPGTGEN